MTDNGRDLNHELPPLVENVREGWQETSSGSAVVTSLLAAVATGLLSLINDVVNNGDFKQQANPHALTFLYVASFGAIILSASATVTSLFLIDKLGDLPALASDLDKPREGKLASDIDILVYYGLGDTWTLALWHWIISLVLGIWCLFLQVIVFVYMTQTTPVIVVATIATIFAVLPMVYLLFKKACRLLKGPLKDPYA
ncbi:hypothetical protein ARMGADRAFT_602903 [Armillaria gallica]|uniref:Uncharacterized protein n=1 Tax=Armillaria gallica TaxID=47427 RepID=A0A2H3D1S1_ARMGA|nr:hypothetical protein ARMGADRAFT_602903 [Armillaria gallica]